jgi:carbon monoxide dehydrogenase subunit G
MLGTGESARFARAQYIVTVPKPVITYRRSFRFHASPEKLWDRIEELDQFELWFPWLTDFSFDGDGLSAGTVLTGVVSPPLPYRMRLRVELDRSERPTSIDATIGGDLTGNAHIHIRPDADGAMAEVSWSVEMLQPIMRIAWRFGRPLLQWGHDRVVEITVANFRPRIEGA